MPWVKLKLYALLVFNLFQLMRFSLSEGILLDWRSGMVDYCHVKIE